MKRIFSAAAFREHEGEAAYRNNPWVKECDGKEIIGERERIRSPGGDIPPLLPASEGRDGMSADVIGLLISVALLGLGMLPLFGLYKLGVSPVRGRGGRG